MADITRARKPGHRLGGVANELLRQMLGARSLTRGVIAIHGSNKENVLTTAAVLFSIDGVIYNAGADTEIDISALTVINESGTTTAMTTQLTAFDRVYLLVHNSSGTQFVIEGQDVATGGSTYCPGCPDAYAPFAAVKVANASGSTFTFGTTDVLLTAAGITDTYYDLAIVPSDALA